MTQVIIYAVLSHFDFFTNTIQGGGHHFVKVFSRKIQVFLRDCFPKFLRPMGSLCTRAHTENQKNISDTKRSNPWENIMNCSINNKHPSVETAICPKSPQKNAIWKLKFKIPLSAEHQWAVRIWFKFHRFWVVISGGAIPRNINWLLVHFWYVVYLRCSGLWMLQLWLNFGIFIPQLVHCTFL